MTLFTGSRDWYVIYTFFVIWYVYGGVNTLLVSQVLGMASSWNLMKMYYEKIVKESKKANPNRDVIKNYLNM